MLMRWATFLCVAAMLAGGGADRATAQAAQAAQAGAAMAVAKAPAILSVSGTGRVAMRPDMARISVGVETVAPTADRALRANSARMQALIAVLRDFGVADADLQTDQLSLDPRFETRERSSREPLRVVGFVASNTLTAQIRDLPRLGAILDAVVKAGANRIFGISFGIADPAAALDRARVAAVSEARHKAEVLAAAAGVGLGPLLSIDEGGSGLPPVMPQMRAMAMEEPVPVAEGQVELSATVTLRFALTAER